MCIENIHASCFSYPNFRPASPGPRNILFETDPHKMRNKRNERKKSLIRRAHELAVISGGEVFLHFTDENNNTFTFSTPATWEKYVTTGKYISKLIEWKMKVQKVNDFLLPLAYLWALCYIILYTSYIWFVMCYDCLSENSKSTTYMHKVFTFRTYTWWWREALWCKRTADRRDHIKATSWWGSNGGWGPHSNPFQKSRSLIQLFIGSPRRIRE